MNKVSAPNDSQNDPQQQVNWLFLDLNSFFASCEQQENPELRGKPVAIVATLTDYTCAIAASSEAKKFGIKTGTGIGDAKRLCPDLRIVKARQDLYRDYHHRVVNAVETCLHVTKISSIDEMACRLMGNERVPERAQGLAQHVKATLRRDVGDCLTASIGLAPSIFLGKVGSDMQKPDGLVTITRSVLPEVLYPLALQDIYGIGRKMERRLHQSGILTTQDLMAAPREQLRRIWGGITGALFHDLLHGADYQMPESLHRHSLGHQHVLEPNLRNLAGARAFSRHLLAKAAERLRHKGYYARRLGLHIAWVDDTPSYWSDINFHETQGTDFLLSRLDSLWRSVPDGKPVKVGVVLLDLVPATRHQMDLFAEPVKSKPLSPLIDSINRRYGRHTIGFGMLSPELRNFGGHAAFQHVPEAFEFGG
jgi:DNA polymerase-4